MPGEEIDRPNPQPLPSDIDDRVLSLGVSINLQESRFDEACYVGLQEFRRAANYIAAGKSSAHIIQIPDGSSH